MAVYMLNTWSRRNVYSLDVCSDKHHILSVIFCISTYVYSISTPTLFLIPPFVSFLCGCSWRVTWSQVSEKLCRGSYWRWRACIAKSAPDTPSSRPWFAGSVACSDSPKAETDTQTLAKTPNSLCYSIKTSAKHKDEQHQETTKDPNFLSLCFFWQDHAFLLTCSSFEYCGMLPILMFD